MRYRRPRSDPPTHCSSCVVAAIVTSAGPWARSSAARPGRSIDHCWRTNLVPSGAPKCACTACVSAWRQHSNRNSGSTAEQVV
ncbi:hypothetical protein SALBM311S_05670 [Streptomyces alboniger]